MPKVIAITVGGSPEPIIYSIDNQQPDYVLFITSKESREALRTNILPNLEHEPKDHIVITLNDIQNLLACVRDTSKGLKEARRVWGLPNGEFIGDITGGNKVMTAALALALSKERSRFSYVGGDRRNKNGLGTVESGHETLLGLDNPWDVLAIYELREIQTLFNSCQFTAMRRLAKETAGRLQRGEFFTFLDRVGEAYDHWDGFRYEVALPVLRRAEREIGTMACAASSEHVDDFHTTLMEHVGHVDAVIKAYKLLAGHVAGNGKTLDPKPFLADLLANAARRAESGRYDDAVARLYCAIEKIAKIRLQVGYGLNTSDIDLDLVPENERADLLECRSDEGKIRLPLARSYELLRRLGDPLGESYKQRSQQLDQVLYQRNNSFLAHGFTPMGEKHYQKLMDISLEFLGINEDELPKFPKMDWEGMVL